MSNEHLDAQARQLARIKRFQEAAKARYPAPKTSAPTQQDITAWCEATPQMARATDGCSVDLDGVCTHGYPSWLIMFGLVADPGHEQ